MNNIIVENWKKIIGYENYDVSDIGNVRNSTTGRVLKHALGGNGYYTVSLYKDGKQKTMSLHRLVGTAFIVNPDDKLYIDHIDNCKTNNHFSNLRWATVKENSMNSKISKNNTSGCKGVCYNKRINKWCARIVIDSIQIHIGYYETLEEAKQARIKRANDVFGEFTNACEKQ
jgi:hypothetical protein